MRDNSGSGKSSNNVLDPTLKEHAGQGGHHEARPAPGDEAEIGGNAKQRGEQPSPGGRGRGETAGSDKTPPLDFEPD